MTTAHQEKFDKFQQIQSKIYLSNRHCCSPRCQCNEGFSFYWFILCFSRCHFPTNSVATFVFNLNQIQAVIPLFALIKDSKRQLQKLFGWPVYSVDENKLCCSSPRNKDSVNDGLLIYFSFETLCCNKLDPCILQPLSVLELSFS